MGRLYIYLLTYHKNQPFMKIYSWKYTIFQWILWGSGESSITVNFQARQARFEKAHRCEDWCCHVVITSWWCQPIWSNWKSSPNRDENTKFQESYNTPQEHTPGNPLANYERNPFVACWWKFRGVLQRCVETTLKKYLSCHPLDHFRKMVQLRMKLEKKKVHSIISKSNIPQPIFMAPFFGSWAFHLDHCLAIVRLAKWASA